MPPVQPMEILVALGIVTGIIVFLVIAIVVGIAASLEATVLWIGKSYGIRQDKEKK